MVLIVYGFPNAISALRVNNIKIRTSHPFIFSLNGHGKIQTYHVDSKIPYQLENQEKPVLTTVYAF